MEYPKINSIYKRDVNGKLIPGEYSQEEFKYLENCQWFATEKVDGTNIRIIWDGEKVEFRGRTDKAIIQPTLLKTLNESFTDIDLYRQVFGNQKAIVYGEGYGNGIQQAGKHYLPNSNNFIAFDINISGWWLKREDVLDLCSKMNIIAVPYIAKDTLVNLEKIVINGFNSDLTKYPEGIVAKPLVDLYGRDGKRVIVKIKRKDYSAQS